MVRPCHEKESRCCRGSVVTYENEYLGAFAPDEAVVARAVAHLVEGVDHHGDLPAAVPVNAEDKGVVQDLEQVLVAHAGHGEGVGDDADVATGEPPALGHDLVGQPAEEVDVAGALSAAELGVGVAERRERVYAVGGAGPDDAVAQKVEQRLVEHPLARKAVGEKVDRLLGPQGGVAGRNVAVKERLAHRREEPADVAGQAGGGVGQAGERRQVELVEVAADLRQEPAQKAVGVGLVGAPLGGAAAGVALDERGEGRDGGVGAEDLAALQHALDQRALQRVVAMGGLQKAPQHDAALAGE
ncbi:ABC transporter permease [Babesia caballi]|uniref:ABC transporter permease n=1 Tax=Babesia caballi TaxID=5871 RepID=A0AAV4LT29_BABCB|nr:ABC transporter permease [Babesia caballi]